MCVTTNKFVHFLFIVFNVIFNYKSLSNARKKFEKIVDLLFNVKEIVSRQIFFVFNNFLKFNFCRRRSFTMNFMKFCIE